LPIIDLALHHCQVQLELIIPDSGSEFTLSPHSTQGLCKPNMLLLPNIIAQLDVGSALAGVFSHLGYFINREHHIEAPCILQLFFAAVGILCLTLFNFLGYGLVESAGVMTLMAGAYLLSIFASMFIYRVFFPPLKKIPRTFLGQNIQTISCVPSWKLRQLQSSGPTAQAIWRLGTNRWVVFRLKLRVRTNH
jgi:hypothetical protein